MKSSTKYLLIELDYSKNFNTKDLYVLIFPFLDSYHTLD